MTSIDIESRILGTLAGRPAPTSAQRPPTSGPSFGQVLQDQQLATQAAKVGIKFSGHAQTRLASRQITLTGDEMTRLGAAITQAAAKGARESLVVMDKAALVVSVPNRTVITAVDKASLKENIFTNIDSAMILG